jgi:hypothetical protein
MEVLNRGWYIEGMAVRPDHRMVAHTGFLTTGRWIGEGSRAVTPAQRERVVDSRDEPILDEEPIDEA